MATHSFVRRQSHESCDGFREANSIPALPERCANLCFGGARRNRLFMAASHSLYSLYVNTQGAAGG